MRVLLDTNVLAAAFGTRGLCADVLRVVLAEHQLVVGEVVLTELERVLAKRFKVLTATVGEILSFLREYEVVPKPKKPAAEPVRDPSDGWILASAVDGRADVLITGDRDLLDLSDRSPLPILDPRGFWTRLRKDG